MNESEIASELWWIKVIVAFIAGVILSMAWRRK
jgi:hypothetical protein